MNAIAISNVAIRQTENNLYNLNDLHKASGGEDRHAPRRWLQNQQTTELIEELSKDGNPSLEENQQVIKVVRGGNKRGTYACKELVYAYATWISAKFFLLVIRTFDAVISGGPAAKTTADDRTPLRQAVAALVGRKGIDYSTAYGMVHQRFNVGAIEDLPAEKLPEAVAYVHALTLHAGLAGEVLDAVSDPRGRAVVPDGEIADGIACLLAQSYRACGFLKRYLPAFRSLGLDGCGEMHGFVYDAAASRDAVNRWLHANRAALSRRTAALLPELAASYEDGGCVRYPLVWAQ